MSRNANISGLESAQLLDVDVQERNDIGEGGNSSHIRTFNNEPSEDYDQLQTLLGIFSLLELAVRS
jgi:hypothetical protein